MSCEEFDSVVIDLARGEAFSGSAAAHAEVCRRCSARLAEQREITEALWTLAGAAEGREAPACVEAQLLSAFRRQQRRTRAWPVLAAAAGIVLLIGAVALRSLRQHPSGRADAPLPLVEARLDAPARPVPAPAPQPPKKRRPPRAAPVVNRREVATDFFPMIYGDALDPLEGGQVVRIRLPRSALMSFGLPVNQEQPAGRVDADVLLGEDGMARVIRFVK